MNPVRFGDIRLAYTGDWAPKLGRPIELKLVSLRLTDEHRRKYADIANSEGDVLFRLEQRADSPVVPQGDCFRVDASLPPKKASQYRALLDELLNNPRFTEIRERLSESFRAARTLLLTEP